MPRGRAPGFPLPIAAFDGGANISRGQSGGDQKGLAELLDQLSEWIAIRGIVDTPSDLPTDAEDGDLMTVRNPSGPGSAPAIYLYDGDSTTWNPVGVNGWPLGDKVTCTSQFSGDLQAAIDAMAAVGGGTVLVTPGVYDPIVIRSDKITLVGVGNPDDIHVRGCTISNCTLASIATFNASADPTDLVIDSGLTDPPKTCLLKNLHIRMTANPGGWSGNAISSLRLLGAPGSAFLVVQYSFGFGTGYLQDGLHVENCRVYGGSIGFDEANSLYAANVCMMRYIRTLFNSRIRHYQCNQVVWDDSTNNDSAFTEYGDVEHYYNNGLPVPPTGSAHFSARNSEFQYLKFTGPYYTIEEFSFNRLTSIEIQSTAGFGAVRECHVDTINVVNLGPTMEFAGGFLRNAPTGAGAGGVTRITGV